MSLHPDCASCNVKVNNDEFIDKTNRKHGITLCFKCKNLYEERLKNSAKYANRLYFTLKALKVDAQLAHWDGYKTIDIYVEKSRLHIEVDGDHHNLSDAQALADLQRTYYAFKDGFFTLRIPNSLIKKRMKDATNLILHIIELLDQTKPTAVFKRA